MLKKTIVMLILVLVVCAMSFNTVSAQVRNLRLGMVEGGDTIAVQAVRKFAELTEKYTDGEIKIDVFPDGVLGTPAEMLDMLSAGDIDFFRGGGAGFEPLHNDYRFWMMLWAFDDNEHVDKFINSPRYEEIKEETKEKRNVKILDAYGLRPARHLFTTVPLRNIEDFDGFILRVADVPMQRHTWPRLGVGLATIAYGEAYMAVQQGVAQGLEQPVDAAYGMSFHEVTDYLVKTFHCRHHYQTGMNGDLYDSLSQENIDNIEKALAEAESWWEERAFSEEDDMIQKMKDEGGLEVIEIDIAPFAERMADAAVILEEQGIYSEGLFDYVRDLSEN